MALERQTEKVLQVAEALFRQPLASLFPLEDTLADWDLRARLEGVLSRALEGSAATASPVEPPVAPREPGRSPELRAALGAHSPMEPAVPPAAFAKAHDVPARQARLPGLGSQARGPGASLRTSGEGAPEPVSPSASPLPEGKAQAESRARATAQSTLFPQSGTVAELLGLSPAEGAPSLSAISQAGEAHPLALERAPLPAAERVSQAPSARTAPHTGVTPSARTAPSMPSLSDLPERAAVPTGLAPAREAGTPAPRAVRMVSTPSELAALLQSHVSAPEDARPRPMGLHASPEAAAVAVPRPAHASAGASIAPSPEVALPEVSFKGTAHDGEASLSAEELLLDKLVDRLQDRMREESIRRFGLTGGDI